MKTLVRISVILLLNVNCLLAQPQIDLWREYHAGSVTYEKFEDVYRYSSGGYLLCGSSGLTGWITKANGEGNQEWNYLLDSTFFASVIEADNGDAVAGGLIWRGPQMFGAVRVNSQGEQVWTHSYVEGSCSAVIELKEGDFMLAGWTGSAGYVARIEPNSDLVWGHEYRTGAAEETHRLYSMRETDEGVVVAGKYQNGNRTNMGWIIKVGFDGRVIWSRTYDGGTGRQFISIISDPQGGFVVGGDFWQRWAWGTSEHKFALMSISADGAVRSDHIYHLVQGRGDQLYGINKLRDGYIMVGYTALLGYMYPLALRVNRAYEPVWNLTFNDQVEARPPGTQPNTPTKFSSTVVGEDGSIIACGGFMSEMDDHGQDALLCRLEPAPLGPQVFYKFPEDSLNTILVKDSVEFIVRARSREGVELHHEWTLGDSAIGGNDTTVTVKFDEVGDYPVKCRLTDADAGFDVNWMIHVRNLFVVDYTPDSLALAQRRGVSQLFSIDSVAVVEGDPVEYQWTVTDLNSQEREDAGTEAGATVEFLRSGNYAVEGLAYRGESSDNVVWTVAVRSAILDFWPRELNLSVMPDSLVSFEVWPFNPESDSLQYRWEVDGDSVGEEAVMEWRFALKDSGQAGRSTYAVRAIVMDGAEGDTVAWTVSVRDPNSTPPLMEGGENPVNFGIVSVSPNPFNSTTTIRFATTGGDARSTRLTLHDLMGREVRECVRARVRAGEHSYVLNGADLPAGIYWVRLETGGKVGITKIALVR